MRIRLSVCMITTAVALLTTSCQPPELSAKKPFFDPVTISDATPVRVFLEGLETNLPSDTVTSPNELTISRGKALLTEGRLPDADAIKLSSYFYCLDCHHTEREQSDLSQLPDPLSTLAFAMETDLPLLPAPTFAGITDREVFFSTETAQTYNPPTEATNSLEQAIQFCSVTVAKGRALEPSEMEAILSYLGTLEFRLADLGLRGADLAELKRRALNPDEHGQIVRELKEQYPTEAVGTAGEPPVDSAQGFSLEAQPDPILGSEIWARACLHCHDADGASEHYFGDKPSTWLELESFFEKGDLYQRLRNGSFEKEKASHMPAFPKEKLSDTQIEHLRAFIRSKPTE